MTIAGSIDLTSHDGLRGIAAVWIMLFHYILFSTFPLDFQGSSLMPLFFLLSGFSLAVSYGRKSDLVTSQLWNFYRNRIARVYPVYLLCCLLALPLWFFGFGGAPPTPLFIVPSIINSILPLCTVFNFVLGGCLIGPGWTVCTLFIMWLRFPYSMEVARKKSDEELVKNIVFYYWMQLALVILLYFINSPFGYWPAFAAATMNPICRYPLFLMGVYAGELCLRYPTLPLPHWPQVWRFFPCMQCFLRFVNPASDQDDVKHWSDIATKQSVYIFLVTLLVSAADAIARYVGGAAAGIGGAVWFQAIVPYCQLEIIVALTRDGGTSLASRFLRHPVWLWLGKLSMCIYLIHYTLMQYVMWIRFDGGVLQWPSDCTALEQDSVAYSACRKLDEIFTVVRQLSMCCVPPLLIASVIAAILLQQYIEIPARKLLRGNNAKLKE